MMVGVYMWVWFEGFQGFGMCELVGQMLKLDQDTRGQLNRINPDIVDLTTIEPPKPDQIG